MLFIKVLASVCALMGIYTAAALQNGPDVTDANLCKLLRRISASVPDQCIPLLDNYGTGIAAIIVFACVILLLWDFRKHVFVSRGVTAAIKRLWAKVDPYLIPIGLCVLILGAIILVYGTYRQTATAKNLRAELSAIKSKISEGPKSFVEGDTFHSATVRQIPPTESQIKAPLEAKIKALEDQLAQQPKNAATAAPTPKPIYTVEALVFRQRALTQLEQFIDTRTDKLLEEASALMSNDQHQRTPEQQIKLATAFLSAVQQYQPDQGKALSRFNGVDEILKLADWNWVAQKFEPALTEYIHTVRLLDPEVPAINAASHPAGGRFLTLISELNTWITKARDAIARQRAEYDKAEVHE